MYMVGKQVELTMQGFEYDGNRAIVMEEKEMGFFKVLILELKNFGKIITVSKYQIKN